jgi:hypothetical protein
MGRAREVLAQFDEAAANFQFPDPDHGYYHAVDARLRAFADAARWAVVVEAVGYTPRGFNLIDVVHTFGNCLTGGKPGYENADFHSLIENLEEIEASDEPEVYLGSAPFRIGGKAITVPAPKGEELFRMFRRLVPDHRDLLFASEAQVRRRLPRDVPQLLQLEEWNQPDLFETPPSQSETFRLIAVVLETLDPSQYRPTLAPNTHWSNWPESGSL